MKIASNTILTGLCLLTVSCTDVNETTIPPVTGEPVDQVPGAIDPSTPSGSGVPVPPIAAVSCNVKDAIDWMTQQKIIYAQNPADEWRDCSGNFLRLASRVASICENVEMPAPAGIGIYRHGSGNNKRPGPADARSSRGLAAWYDQRGMFEPIYYDGIDVVSAPQALQQIRNRIKVGSVLWFSRRTPVAAGGKTALYAEVGGAINHMGTVASVTRDDQGNVVKWEMYHGQNEKKHNELSTHWWDWPSQFTSKGEQYPPGGYWSQRIVGFAESLIPLGAVSVSDSSG